MNFSVQTAKIVGTPDQTTWSQVYTFSPQETEKRKTRGILLTVLSFSEKTQKAETVSTGREIISRIHEEYYGQTEKKPLEELSGAVGKVCQEFSNEEQSLEIYAACLVENVIYLALFGKGQVWLKRQGLVGKILEGNSQKVETGSGFIQKDDLLLLGSTSFFTAAHQDLKTALANNDPQEAVEILAPLVHGRQPDGLTAALVGKIKEEEEFSEEIEIRSEAVLVPNTTRPRNSFKQKFLNKLPKFSLEEIRNRRNQPEARSKKTVFTIAVILAFLLFTSIFFGSRKREQTQKQQQFDQLYSQTQSLLDQGQTLAGANSSQGKDLLFQAKEKVGELEKLKIESAKVTDLANKIDAALNQVVKEYQLADAPVLTDLTLIKEQGRGDSWSLSDQDLAILDKSQSRVLGFNVGQKSGAILAGGESLKNAKLVTSDTDSVWALDDQGIAQISRKTQKTEKGKLALSDQWGEIGVIKIYNSNLYLLDKTNNTIWRYTEGEQGFGTGQKWLKETSVSLSFSVSMAIDGSVWVLNGDGKILKLTQGRLDAFGVAGLDKPFSSPAVIFTDENTQNLYILDKGNQRVVVLAKSGEYQAQYSWPGISGITDMAVLEAEKKILLLGGSKIYEIDLK